MNIVSTSVSSLEGDLPGKADIVSEAVTEMPDHSMDEEADVTIEIEQQSRYLRQLDQGVNDLIEDFHEDDVEIARIDSIKGGNVQKSLRKAILLLKIERRNGVYRLKQHSHCLDYCWHEYFP